MKGPGTSHLSAGSQEAPLRLQLVSLTGLGQVLALAAREDGRIFHRIYYYARQNEGSVIWEMGVGQATTRGIIFILFCC